MMTDFFNNQQIWATIAIIVGFGALGGYASNLLDPITELPRRIQNIRGVVLGILAAATVPLLLRVLTSDLLKDPVPAQNFLVLGGYCIVVALFADRFLRSFGDRVLKDLEEKIDAARANADAALENSSVTTDATGGTAEAPAVEGEPTDAAPTEAEPTDAAPAEESSENESFNPNRKDAKKPPKTRPAAPARSVAPPRSGRERVVDALRDNRFKSRSTGAVALSAGLSDSEAVSILTDLVESGSVKKLTTADGKVFWKMS